MARTNGLRCMSLAIAGLAVLLGATSGLDVAAEGFCSQTTGANSRFVYRTR